MEAIIILIVVTFVFSITIGLIIMNRDTMPDILIEENKKELVEDSKKEFKKEDKKYIIDDEII